ncbi:MAG: hypothetical protein ACUVRK_08720 [Spirochaetota bacterium]
MPVLEVSKDTEEKTVITLNDIKKCYGSLFVVETTDTAKQKT